LLRELLCRLGVICVADGKCSHIKGKESHKIISDGKSGIDPLEARATAKKSV